MIPAPLRAALLAAPFAVLAACGDASSQNAVDGEPGGATTAKSAAVTEIAATDMVMGDPKAPVTIIEYASVTCPHCATFHETFLPGVKEKFIDTGKAKLVFREFPTPPAEFSLIGSLLARCAAEKSGPDAYFLMISSLLKNQRAWVLGEDPKAELLKITRQAGIDEAAFDACLKRQELIDLINANTRAAVETLDISSTPSFVIDGVKTKATSAEQFEAAIAAAVAKAEAKAK